MANPIAEFIVMAAPMAAGLLGVLLIVAFIIDVRRFRRKHHKPNTRSAIDAGRGGEVIIQIKGRVWHVIVVVLALILCTHLILRARPEPKRVEMGAWIVELGTCTDGPVYRQTLIVKGPNGISVFYSPEPNP